MPLDYNFEKLTNMLQFVGPTDVLTVVTETGTVSGLLATVTASLEYAAVTATVASEDDSVGDVSVIISPKLKSTFLELAAKHCGVPAKRIVRRDFASCALDYASDAAGSGSFDLIGNPRLPTISANDIAQVVNALLAARRIPPEAAGGAGVALALLAAWFASDKTDMPNAIKIPAAQVATASTTSSACPPRETGKARCTGS